MGGTTTRFRSILCSVRLALELVEGLVVGAGACSEFAYFKQSHHPWDSSPKRRPLPSPMSIVDIMPHALIAAFITALVVSASQIPLNPAHSAFKDLRQDDYYQFTDEIRRVAVIGAGATGLQTAASLIEHGFEVRLFERADNSGGNWYYQDQTPIHASFP